ncbi:MAG: transglycosylase, partial [Candidatus Nephrothrix sp. EaCA]
LVKTLVISEDRRFYSHSGLDLEAFVRVAFGFLTLHPAGGGSTITQQLAKNLYTKNPNRSLDGYIAKLGRYPRRFVEKTKEWIIAVDLEKNFTKKEIIAMYLNTVEFSNNTYGIKVAAETYFNKSPDSLNLQESAVLVGMLQNPSRYNPKKYPDRALAKRNAVLAKVYSHGYKIKTRKQYDSLLGLPLKLNFTIQNQNQGQATYFRTVLSNYLINYCKKKGIDLWNSGLKIYTTLDSRVQRHAEEAMNAHMSYLQRSFFREWKARNRNPWSDDHGAEIPDFLQRRVKQTEAYKDYAARYGNDPQALQQALHTKRKMTIFTWKGERDTLFNTMDSLNYYKRFLQSGLLAMDPNTGHVKAWVGGFNHKYFKFDHVAQGKRQPGSTFKPFVYGLAMESGHSPCEILKDITPQFFIDGQSPWYPTNADGTKGSGRPMNLRQAMARSVNSITAQMIQLLGAQNVVEFAHRVGIQSRLDAVPSLCLGTSDVSLLEMVDAYCTFVNGGLQIKPLFITRIEDKNGNVIDNFVADTKHAINEQTAYKMLYMLKGGVDERGGTSRGLSWDLKANNDLGGKTGTTNNASDGWYVGVTHNLVCGVWVG